MNDTADNDQMQGSWQTVQSKLRAQIGDEAFTHWFGRMQYDRMSGTQMVLSVPTEFLLRWIREHYLKILTTLWREECGSEVEVVITVRPRGIPKKDAPTNSLVSANQNSSPTPTGSNIRVADVQCTVTQYYNVSMGEICVRRPTGKLKRIRDVAIYLTKDICGVSDVVVAKSFNCDRTIASSVCKEMGGLIASDSVLRQDVRTIRTLISKL